MALVLHGGSCHSHHNHSHGGDLLNHQHKQLRSGGDDEAKELHIEDESIGKTQSGCKSNENINVQAAFLHVLGDFLQSIGVIVAAVIIRIYVRRRFAIGKFMQFFFSLIQQPQAKFVDPIITFLFSIIVVCTTVRIFKESAGILLEAAPSNVSYERLANDLRSINGVWWEIF